MTYRGITVLLLSFLTLALFTTELSAQSYYQSSRAVVKSPNALGMGDAGVAFPSRHNVFFYNPAHLTDAVGLIPRINIVGVQGAASTSVVDQVRFYRNSIQPQIEQGFDVTSESDRQALNALYDEALEVGQQRAFFSGDVMLPSVMLSVGPIGVGAGAFVHSHANYRFRESATDAPLFDFAGRVDAIGVGSAALDLSHFGVSGLSAGVTAKFTQRYLTLKEKPLDEIILDEPVSVYSGTSIGFDAGVLYTLSLPLPGQVTLGAAAYDILASDFNYSYNRSLSDLEPDEQTIQQEMDFAQEYHGLSPSYRVGAAYTIPSLLGLLGDTGIAVDYLGYQDTYTDQSFASRLHLGAQAQLMGMLRVRMGLAQGYASMGAGVGIGFIQFDYAYFAVEEGPLPGQMPGSDHLLQVRVGL